MTQPLVTIGIATRNRCDLLRKAIGSALGQTWPTKEVVVVDDASTDGTSDLAKEFPSVRWVRREAPGGYMSARNEMMLGSGAKYFCGLDDDAWFVGDDALGVAIRAMEANPGWGAVAFDILDPGRPDPVSRGGSRPVDTFIGCGHMLRLDTVRAVSGYVPMPASYGCEEKDLCLRLFDRGVDVVVLPGVHVWHEKAPIERIEWRQRASGVCNDMAFALRRFPWSSLWWRLPAKAINHLQFGLRRGFAIPYLVGLTWFMIAARSVLRTRAAVSPEALKRFLASRVGGFPKVDQEHRRASE